MPPTTPRRHIKYQDHQWSFQPCETSGKISESCGVCNKVTILDKQIDETRGLVEDLTRQRHEIRFVFNEAHLSIIDRMPVEIATHIFELYLVACKKDPAIFSLGAVCRSWRRTVWSIPRLWTSISLQFRVSEPPSDSRMELIEDWFNRSGRLPLTLSINIHWWSHSPPDYSKFQHFFDVINQQSDRWFSVDLDVPDQLVAYLSDKKSTSSILHTLHIRAPGFASPRISVKRAQPVILKLDIVLRWPANVGWNRVTYLIVVSNVYVDEILEILRLAPLLQRCEFATMSVQSDHLWIPGSLPVTHSQVKVLFVQFDESEEVIALFDNVALPALIELDYEGVSDDARHPIITDCLTSFLDRSQCVLETLVLQNLVLTGDDLIAVAKAAPSIISLKLSPYWARDHDQRMDSFFLALSPKHQSDIQTYESRDVVPLVQQLRSFSWSSGPIFPWRHFLNIFSPLNEEGQVVSRRPVAFVDIFCDRKIEDNDSDPIPYIDKDILCQLSAFRSSVDYRFQVTITDEGDTADLWKMSSEKEDHTIHVPQNVCEVV